MLSPSVNREPNYRTKELRGILVRVRGRCCAFIGIDFDRTQGVFPVKQRHPTLPRQAGLRQSEQ
jgi:hypothetical protein